MQAFKLMYCFWIFRTLVLHQHAVWFMVTAYANVLFTSCKILACTGVSKEGMKIMKPRHGLSISFYARMNQFNSGKITLLCTSSHNKESSSKTTDHDMLTFFGYSSAKPEDNHTILC